MWKLATLFFLLLISACTISTTSTPTGGNITIADASDSPYTPKRATDPSISPGGRAGSWKLLLNSSGVVGMHMALTNKNTVVMFDQLRFGPSGLRIRYGESCTRSTGYFYCWAHSVEYNIQSNSIRPLHLETDTWCSSGAFLSNGTLLQTGGYLDGYRRVRRFTPCANGHCDWHESGTLLANRWYASNQILPEGDRVIIVGGRRSFNYEFYPKIHPKESPLFELPFLRKTRHNRREEDNLYPFLHLSTDGNLFIFANQDSILLDYINNKVVRTFPRLEGSRSYPSTGSSVMLPLDHSDNFKKTEIVICGGSRPGAQGLAKQGRFIRALSSCGRMVITDVNPIWEMEDMPTPRLLNDMIILPNGQILIINGAMKGSGGWHNARDPQLSPFLYEPMRVPGHRFLTLRAAEIPRMYHSSAILLPDGRVLVAGSNPNRSYRMTGVRYPTELRVESYAPYFMEDVYDERRPRILKVGDGHGGGAEVKYGERFGVRFQVMRMVSPAEIGFHIYAPPFTTHSVGMNQRMVKLRSVELKKGSSGAVHAVVEAPPSGVVAPAGYYLLFVVNGDIPSGGKWVRFTK